MAGRTSPARSLGGTFPPPSATRSFSVLTCDCPKFICCSPNSQDLSMGLYLEMGLYRCDRGK